MGVEERVAKEKMNNKAVIWAWCKREGEPLSAAPTDTKFPSPLPLLFPTLSVDPGQDGTSQAIPKAFSLTHIPDPIFFISEGANIQIIPSTEKCISLQHMQKVRQAQASLKGIYFPRQAEFCLQT